MGMRILKATADNIQAVALLVKRGGLVIYPTDTVYGLGCDPFNVEAVKRIFAVKGARKKPLPVLASDIEYVEKIVYLSKRAQKITDKFWPGPLTLVLPTKHVLPSFLTHNLDSVGVRMPQHKKAIQLIRFSGGFLVGTSANKAGERPARTVDEITLHLKEDVDVILDDGPTPFGNSSTVVDLTTDGPKILREGPIRLKEILKVLSMKNL